MKSLIALATIILAATAAGAQLKADRDLVVTTDKGIYYVNTEARTYASIVTENGSMTFNAVMMDRTNRAVITVLSSPSVPSVLLRVTAAGGISTLKQVPGNVAALALDQRGQYVACTTSGGLYQTTGVTSTSSLRAIHASLKVNALCREDDTGDLIGGFYGSAGGYLVRIRAATGSVTTITTGLPAVYGIDHDQRTGDFLVAAQGKLMRLDASGSVLASVSIPSVNCVHVDDTNGRIYVGAGSRVEVRYDNLSVRTRFGLTGAASTITGITMWGSRKLASPTTNTARGGTYYRVNGEFTSSPNRTYACGIGISGMRPGLDVGARRVNIKPDPLFFLTASESVPLFTRRFIGVTNAIGQFSADFLLPKVVSSFPPITFVAAVVNTTLPGNLDIAAAHTVKILP